MNEKLNCFGEGYIVTNPIGIDIGEVFKYFF